MKKLINIIDDLLENDIITHKQYYDLKRTCTDFHDSNVTKYKVENEILYIEINDIELQYNLKSYLSRHERRQLRNIKKPEFLKIFNFYVNGYKKQIFDFCGTDIKTLYKENAYCSKIMFKKYDNGDVPLDELEHGIYTSEPELLRCVILGKKGWGLWMQEWCKGISEFLFTEDEILNIFKNKNIEIPESLLVDFKKTWRKKRDKIIFN